MAELTTQTNRPDKKVRSRKLSSKVDLTAMVDLAFLLITFFMLTTSLTKPQSMSLALPDKDGAPGKVDEGRTLTLIIDGENKAKAFMGKLSDSQPTELSLHNTSQLRKEIVKRKKQAIDYTGNPDKGLIVLIKPGEKSNYKNLIDVLDEMVISDVGTYAITDLLPEEQKLLASR